MDRLALGSSDVEIPPIGIGTWAWGVGLNGGNQVFGHRLGVDELRPVFRAAVDAGLTFFDTAAVYAMGGSERILGELLGESGRAQGLVLATKFTPLPFHFSRGTMRKWLRKSLARLGAEAVDLYQIHGSMGLTKWIDAIGDLREEGLVRAIGVSNFSLDQLEQAAATLGRRGLRLHAVQNHFSLLYRGCERSGVIRWCRENDVTLLSYMVLEQGALSNRFSPQDPPPKRSRRGRAYGGKLLAKIKPLIEELTAVGGELGGLTVAEVAAAWAIAKGTVPLVGATRPEHPAGCLRAIEATLDESTVTRLDDAADRLGIDLRLSWEPKM